MNRVDLSSHSGQKVKYFQINFLICDTWAATWQRRGRILERVSSVVYQIANWFPDRGRSLSACRLLNNGVRQYVGVNAGWNV